jgi:hypothetical protein
MKGNLSLNISNIHTVYYHGSCPDGIIAREVLKLTNKPMRYIPYYFSEFTEVPKNTLFIDCSPKQYQVETALQNNCLIAEHHDSFDWAYWNTFFPKQLFFGENTQAESGAELALWILGVYDPTFHDERVIDLVRHIAIGDTWQSTDPDFRYARMIGGYISFFGNDFCEDIRTLMDKENVITAFGAVQERNQERFAKTAIRLHTHDHKLAFINETNMSGAAEILRNEGNDVIVGFKMIYDPQLPQNIIIYSLRSNERFDCAKFCKANGGGGHKAAAGFSIPYNNQDPISSFFRLFAEYEG